MNVHVVAVLLVVVFIVWYVRRRRNSRFHLLIDRLPGPKPVPLIGNVWEFCRHKQIQNPLWALVRIMEKFSNDGFVRFWMFGSAHVIITKPKAIEALLSSTVNISKAKEYSLLHEWLGLGLLTSTGSRWHHKRKMLTPSFHFRIMDDFMKIFNENSSILLKKLEQSSAEGIFDVTPLVTLCALDIICESAMGKAINAQIHSDSSYVRALQEIGRIISERTVSPWIRPHFLFRLSSHGRRQKRCLKVLHSFTQKVIRERKVLFDEQRKNANRESDDTELYSRKKTRLAFLDLMLEASLDGKTMSENDIREEVDTFMFEGHDTTASAMSFTLYLLGRHPEEQEKVYNELKSVLGDEPVITSAHLAQLKYLDAVIKESMRLFPPAALLARQLDTTAVLDGRELPPLTNIVVLTFLVHRDPQLFPEPEKFDPSRFLKADTDGASRIKAFSYIPFSAGPRNCIGQKFAQMEEKCVLANVVRTFRIVSHQPPEELQLSAELILHSVNGILISLDKRTN